MLDGRSTFFDGGFKLADEHNREQQGHKIEMARSVCSVQQKDLKAYKIRTPK